MVYNCFIQCQVCKSITRIRLQVGFLNSHPINIACMHCGISLNGSVKIGQEMPALEFDFENADIIEEYPGTCGAFVAECSGEFPTRKLQEDTALDQYVLSPFMRFNALMGHERYAQFSKSFSRLNQLHNDWPQLKRIFELFRRGNRTYLFNELWKILPKQLFPCRDEFEIERAVHMIEIISFIDTLRPDITSNKSLTESVLHLPKEQVFPLIDFLNAHSGYSITELQASIYNIYDEFVSVYPYLIPAYALQFCDEKAVDLDVEGSSTSSLDSVKQFSLDAYEALGNLLVIPVALNNVLIRCNFNQCMEKGGQSISLEEYIKLQRKGVRYHYCDSTERYTKELGVILNAKLRNAIGHNDTQYDPVSQIITYIPNPKDRTKTEQTFLLEFENEALHLFQAITVIAEYIYRLREFEKIKNGHDPNNFIQVYSKVGRNEPCPCGSGLKYKKCHGKNPNAQ